LAAGTAAGAALGQERTLAPTPSLQILAAERANNREQRVIFRLGNGRAGIAGLSVRSGSDSVQLLSFEVAYANGEHKTIELGETILPGRQSQVRPVDSAVPITEVILWKRPGLDPGETMFQLLGTRKREAPPNHAAASGGFKVLASQNVDQRGERILFRLGRGEHRYTAIKIRALDDPITITRAEVQFENGQKQTFEGFTHVKPGQETLAYEITGEPRQINRITAWKLASPHPGRTGVELLGLAANK
jgi:hypothetical protein